jgi:hypothetical protein
MAISRAVTSGVAKASALIALGALCVAMPAAADTAPLEDRIAALEAMVKTLQEQLKSQQALNADSLLRVEKQVESVKAETTEATEGFLVGETRFKVGGFVDLDVHVTDFSQDELASNSIGRDFYNPGLTPIGGNRGEEPSTDFTAQSSRLFLSANRDVAGQKSSALLEFDFLASAQGDERVTNSFAPRLRRAFLTHGNWLFGQEWSTFQNTSTIPESVSFLVATDGLVFVRQPQIRFTAGDWQFALENANATIGIGSMVRVEADDNVLPDLVARRNFTGEFGNVSVSGLVRQIKGEGRVSHNSTRTLSGDHFVFAASVAGAVNVTPSDRALFSVSYGKGLGRYVGLNAFNDAEAFNDPRSEIVRFKPVPILGVMAGWHRQLSPTSRLSAAYSYGEASYDNNLQVDPVVTATVQSLFGAVLWDIAPKVTTGFEVMLAHRELLQGEYGNMARMTYSVRYNF